MNGPLVWIDCEMTGLDLTRDALVEVSALVTDSELNILGDGVDVVIRPPAPALETMPDVVREMHTASGLLDALDAGMTIEQAQDAVLSYIREYVPDPRKAPLCGNTVGTDRGFLARDMPELESHLHYRIVDVSSIKELARRWYPRVYFSSPSKSGNHRALADIRESIAELRYYRAALFVPAPGPDSAAAKTLAAQHTLSAQDHADGDRAAAGNLTSPTPTSAGVAVQASTSPTEAAPAGPVVGGDAAAS